MRYLSAWGSNLMAYMICTNIAIRLRDGDAATLTAVAALDDAVLMSIVTRIELEGGVFRDPSTADIRRARLDAMLVAIPTLAFDDEAAATYGRIVARAGYSRRKVLDRMIAAQALCHKAVLVTANGDDFRDVPGLTLLEW
jgi:tRNA(fMet)-specific endonuclease VapC